MKQAESKEKKIVYVDMDGVLVDFNRMKKEKNLVTDEEIDAYVDHNEGVFRNLKPIDGAIEAFKFLSDYFDTYILTTAPWKNIASLSEKREWVGKYLPGVADKRLIISHRKDLNKGDYIIDDRDAKGVDKFEGEHIWFDTDEFPDWQSVIDYLCEKDGIPNYNLR